MLSDVVWCCLMLSDVVTIFVCMTSEPGPGRAAPSTPFWRLLTVGWPELNWVESREIPDRARQQTRGKLPPLRRKFLVASSLSLSSRVWHPEIYLFEKFNKCLLTFMHKSRTRVDWFFLVERYICQGFIHSSNMWWFLIRFEMDELNDPPILFVILYLSIANIVRLRFFISYESLFNQE